MSKNIKQILNSVKPSKIIINKKYQNLKIEKQKKCLQPTTYQIENERNTTTKPNEKLIQSPNKKNELDKTTNKNINTTSQQQTSKTKSLNKKKSPYHTNIEQRVSTTTIDQYSTITNIKTYTIH